MQRDPPHIVLVGPMGVGKTSVGRALAGLLDRPFLDSDAEIERSRGRTSGEIASDLGVATLHELELRTFLDLAKRATACVIAPASSVVDFADGRAVLAECDTVRLTAPHEVTLNRMMLDTHRREMSEEEMVELARRRSPFFEEVALITIDTTGISVEETARRIVTQLERAGGA
jgi:shikimate kinase